MQQSQIRSTSTFSERCAHRFGLSGPFEFWLFASFFSCLVVFCLANVLRQKIDSDEPQHLHVIWEWTRGLVQYRDVFDNHMPLVHIAFAPIAALIGERATILYWMRFALLPLYFVSAWCTYRIGSLLFSQRTGLWAMIAVGFLRGYYIDATDFRTDNVWIPLWLLSLTVLISGALNVRRALIAGLLLGLCFGVSMKSIVPLISLATSAATLLIIADKKRKPLFVFRCAAAFLAATVVIPVTIIGFFAAKGLWPDFRRSVFDFNLATANVFKKDIFFQSHPVAAVLILTTTLIGALVLGRFILSRSNDRALAGRRVFVLFVCVFYFVTLRIFWPGISRVYPPIGLPAATFAIAGLLAISQRLRWPALLKPVPLPALIVLIEIMFVIGTPELWKDRTREQTNLLRNILALTAPDDFVFDSKGETIFRHRAFYPVLERITKKQIARGLMTDNAPQRCVATKTCVAVTSFEERWSQFTRDFIEQNYLPVAKNLRVAGLQLRAQSENSTHFDFNVVIPAAYKIISSTGVTAGVLDGSPCDGARFLGAGPHSFDAASSGEIICLWAQAVDRRFTPFAIAAH